MCMWHPLCLDLMILLQYFSISQLFWLFICKINRCCCLSPQMYAYMNHCFTGRSLLARVIQQTITYVNADLLSIGTNFTEISIRIQNMSFNKIHSEVPSIRCWTEVALIKCRPLCSDVIVLMIFVLIECNHHKKIAALDNFICFYIHCVLRFNLY